MALSEPVSRLLRNAFAGKKDPADELVTAVNANTTLSSATAGTATASKAMVTNASNEIGALAGLCIGAAIQTNPQARLAIIPGAKTITANQSYHHQNIAPSAAVTVPAGTAPIVSSLAVAEPNITATGTVTVGATVYIKDAPTEGGSNYALFVDAGVTRIDGNLDMSDSALDIVAKANTAAALEITDGTVKMAAFDSRNTLKDVATLTITAVAPTIATEAAAHINASLRTANKTITYTSTTTTTSSLGTQAYFGITTLTDASVATLTTASAIHINAIAAAGGSLTITNSRMISTSVTDCFLTNLGVWTDTACWASGKKYIGYGTERVYNAIDSVLAKIRPATWKYRDIMMLPGIDDQGQPQTQMTRVNDHGRQRVGIIYDDLPEELRAPGEDHAVSAGVLASFGLAAIKLLWAHNQELEERLAALEARLA